MLSHSKQWKLNHRYVLINVETCLVIYLDSCISASDESVDSFILLRSQQSFSNIGISSDNLRGKLVI